MRRLIATFTTAAALFLCLIAATFGALNYPVSAAGNTLHGEVLDSASTPIGGIEVILLKRDANQDWKYHDDQLSDALTGAFSFDALDDGDYTLEYSNSTGTWLHQYYLGKSTLEEADPIPLFGGASEGITATLQRAASIEGRVTNDAQPSAPLSSVPVTLWRQTGDTWIKEDNSFPTGNDGIFRAAGLSGGVYRLHFGYSGGGEYFDIWYPDSATLEDAQDVTLAAGGQRTGIDVRLPRKSAIVGSLALPNGVAGADFRVCAVAAGTPTSGINGAPTACASDDLTDGNGVFEIPNLRAGTFLLYVQDDVFPQRVYDRWYPAPPTSAPVQFLTLASGATLPVDPISVVAADNVFGTVLSAQGTPANGVQVRLYEATDDGLRWDHTAWTNAAGQFDLQLRRPSTWTVGYIDPSGQHAPLYFPDVDTLADSDITAVPTETHSFNAGTVLVTGRSVQGRVVDGQGHGVAGIEVHTFFPADSGGREERGRMMPEWLRVVTTNADGAYIVSGLGLESALFYFRDAAGLLQPKWYGAGGAAVDTIGEASLVTVAAGGGSLATLVLAEAASMTSAVGEDWQIRNQVTGIGIEGARVTLYWLPGWRARNDSADDEPYTCPAFAPAGTNAEGTNAAGALSPDGVLAFASARILQPDQNPQRSDANGNFGWRLPPGCWQVRAEATGYYSATSAVWGVGLGKAVAPDFSLALERIGGEPTPSPTPTRTPTLTPSSTPLPTSTHTATPKPTSTATPVPATAISTPTPTEMPSSAATTTPGTTPTEQSHGTPVDSNTPTYTPIPDASPDATQSHNQTPNPGDTPTPDFTPTATQIPAATGEPTGDPIGEPTDEPTVEATIEPPSITLRGVIFADSNRNGRKDEAEIGIAGVRLQIEAVTGLDAFASVAWLRQALTDSAGQFTFSGVPLGQYTLRLTPPIGMTLLTPATLPLIVSGGEGQMSALHLGIVIEPAPVLLPLIGK